MPIWDGTAYAGKQIMKIAPIQSGHGQIPVRTQAAPQKAPPKPQAGGKIRHVLHGWRVLMAPLVTQVLVRTEPAAHTVPLEDALQAYRRWQSPPPAPRRLRDI